MVHNDEVPNQQTSFTDYSHKVAKLLQRHFSRVEVRGLRKLLLATIFTTIAMVYIVWLIIPMGFTLANTALSTFAAAAGGLVYLWRTGIKYSIEMTIFAIMQAGFIQYWIAPIIYSNELTQEEYWYIFSYISFFISLLLAYILAYIFFNSWRAPYKTKLVVAAIFIAIIIAVQIMLRTGE